MDKLKPDKEVTAGVSRVCAPLGGPCKGILRICEFAEFSLYWPLCWALLSYNGTSRVACLVTTRICRRRNQAIEAFGNGRNLGILSTFAELQRHKPSSLPGYY